MWSVRHYNIFTSYLIKATIFKKRKKENLTELKSVCVDLLYIQLLSDTLLILRRAE